MPTDETPPWRSAPGGVLLFVRATPRASRSVVQGWGADADGRGVLLVRLAAPPVDGAANSALIALLAEALHVRKRDVTIRSGETARAKQVHVSGDEAQLIARLERLSAP